MFKKASKKKTNNNSQRFTECCPKNNKLLYLTILTYEFEIHTFYLTKYSLHRLKKSLKSYITKKSALCHFAYILSMSNYSICTIHPKNDWQDIQEQQNRPHDESYSVCQRLGNSRCLIPMKEKKPMENLQRRSQILCTLKRSFSNCSLCNKQYNFYFRNNFKKRRHS